jgi:hypothetical protein
MTKAPNPALQLFSDLRFDVQKKLRKLKYDGKSWI